MEKTYYSSGKHSTRGQTPCAGKLLLLLLMMIVAGVGEAWAQTDLSGTYYIANYKLEEGTNQYYSETDLTKNYYLCPAEGYVYYKANNAYQTDDSGMPFLTTYKGKADDSYDLNKAIWKITKAGSYYTIMHAATGKYVTFNGQISGTSKAGRMRFHLESSDNPTANNNMLFSITLVDNTTNRYFFKPKNSSTNSLNPAKGNQNTLTAEPGANNVNLGKEGAPSGMSIYGIVGIYDAKTGEYGSQWRIEPAIKNPVFSVNADGSVVITSPDGYDIRYTTDGTEPTLSSTLYSSAISITDNTKTIKAIVVRTSANSSIASEADSLQVKEYTYKILNHSNEVAIKHTVRQAVGSPLNGYASIPADIRSPYISDETVKFSASTSFDDEDLIDKTPASATGTADIYISYSLDKLQNKLLQLNGARSLNITLNGEYIFYENSAFGHESSNTNLDARSRLWRFYGGDPYAVTIQNAGSNSIYLQYTAPASGETSSALSMGSTASKFIIMDGATDGAGIANGQMELMAATGDDNYYRVGRSGDSFTVSTTSGHDASLQIRVYSNSSAKTYHLIDRLGKEILTVESKSDILALPDTLQSPLADYQFWNLDAFNDSIIRAAGTYKLREGDGEHPAPTPLSNVSDATGDIYVTYTVKNDIDLTGNKTYMLKFLDGIEFYQENGHDVIYSTKSQAYYPYNNGDFNLFVNGMSQWEEQQSSGASTRTRWLWYFVSNKNGTDLKGDSIDPYHIIVKSNQNQSIKVAENGKDVSYKGSTYLRTYKPNDEVGIITGVVAKHEDKYTNNATYNYQTPSEAPTEYMLLGTSINNLRLRTVDGHLLVNRFEQYWKNNPVANNLLDAGGKGKITAKEENVTLSAAQRTFLQEANETLHKGAWHSYDAWAYSAPWKERTDGSTNKKFELKEHWFQTIDMGSGAFIAEETDLDAMLILLDQHGWEIARLPLPKNASDNQRYAAIQKYSSPMVSAYHYWKTGNKVSGYHKYNVADYVTIDEVSGNGDTLSYTTSKLGELGKLPNIVDAKGKPRDLYVTYDVKSEYARAYAGAATAAETSASLYLVKQGDNYAKISGTSLDVAGAPEDMEHIPYEMQWYLKPNFDIDKEMGYKYDGEDGAQYGAKSKADTEADYVTDGKNGFDPYNMQIQSAKTTTRYFTSDTDNPKLSSGVWTGSTTKVTLENLNTKKTATGHDQTTLSITNATFMVVDDGDGNMLLMPRFDHSQVVNSLTNPQMASPNSATNYLTLELVPKVVHNSNEIKSQGGYFVLADDFTVSTSVGTADKPFMGTIDGKLNTYSGFTSPLVAYSDGAVIKNVMLDNVSISSGATVKVGNDNKTATGALVCVATGATRIYNCGILASESTVTTDDDGFTHISSSSSSVSTGDYVGGLVGFLDGESRVINCFSYADITGGTTVGGIVGYNAVAGSGSNNLKTMVMNCMFYGDITGGTNKAPIYNGNIISNKDANGVSNFNYFRADASYVQPTGVTYNCALMAEIRYLQRFEFFRHLLNSHRELAAWWALDDYSAKDQMMKWVLEPSQIGTTTPYPILKEPGQYPSVVNIDAAGAEDFSADADEKKTQRNEGRRFADLAVTIRMDDTGDNTVPYHHPDGAALTKTSLSLPITDKDPAHFNYNYYKVQLPYYNDVGTKNYNGNRVVTGWKIVSITGGTPGSYTTGDDATATVSADGEITLTTTPYNFADRNCTDKDLYTESKRVFNQGAYWDVPEGVTAITIEPYWAKAAYLADANADVVYNQGMSTATQVPNVGGGTLYTNGRKYAIAGEEQVVYTAVGNARNALDKNTTHNVYDNAIVLVGNAHNIGVSSGDADRIYTLMSIDADHDNEPDYSYILRYDSRCQTHPVRVDFLNIPGLGMAQKSDGGTGSYNFGIMQPIGWFESTNTSLFRVTQFEYDRSNRAAAPYIVQGGVIEQWVSGQNNGAANNTTYFHVGGNVWFKEFHRGTHQDKTFKSKHTPVSVTGGDYDEFYLTGLYRGDVSNYEDNAECYINGGRFGTLAGAAMEGIGKTGGAGNTGNIIWQVQNADIDEFYGGGLNAAHPVEGNITTVIDGGYIRQFCGGPKFGDMNAGKKVTTNATDCIFGTYYGAGYGGNSYSRYAPANKIGIMNINWNDWVKSEYKQNYVATYGGVSTQIGYQFLPLSDNAKNVARLFVEFVKFSLATTRDVTSTLTDCTVTGNFYGGGSLGKVDGPVTSTLTDCTVEGNVFGAGYSGALPTVEVDSIGFRTEPYYYTNLGTYRTGVKGATTTYTWEHGNAISVDNTNHILYTTEDLTTLGTVTGQVTLNIEGSTTVGGQTDGGNVYGGGESSDATGDVAVNVEGGEMADVYGGGKGQTTVVGGDVKVNIGAKGGSGDGPVIGNVYGGSALGAVNATKDATTKALTYTADKKDSVNIYRGTISGSVYGGGLGELTDTTDIAAQNFGPVTVTMEGGTVGTALYGGSNANGVLKRDVTVKLLGGTVGTAPAANDPTTDAVFGGGKGAPTLVEGNVTVDVGSLTGTTYSGTAVIHGNVYGGSALGNTNASRPADELQFDATKTTTVNLYGGTVNGSVYGGGLGRQEVEGQEADGDTPAIEHQDAIAAYVGGDVTVLLDGAKVRQIFGANNLNGTPKGDVLVHVKRTVNSTGASSKDPETPRDERTTYDVEAVYGGGNQADYIPTKATGTDAEKADASAKVIIEGCDTTSIQYVYGGGNAAAVPATDVTILGSYIIEYVFGGGNGKGEGNPGANIGTYANGSTEYGTGKAVTKLVGGHIIYVFGGSDTKGNVRGGTSLTMPESDGYDGYDFCDVRDIKEIYGAGNKAEQDGEVTLILGCVDNMDYVYGGAREANVKGGVDLVVTSGSFKGVFGGNNLSGTIQGPITVTIEETGCDPLEIDNLYLGGNQAAYSVYGYKEVTDSETGITSLVARTGMDDGTAVNPPDDDTDDENITEHQLYRDPILNIVSCTSIGNAFGGGLGNGAVMYGNPTVNVNMIPGKFAPDIVREGVYPANKVATTLGTIGNVYGGGEQANVVGNTTVNICTADSVTVRSRMGAEVNNEPTAVLGALITDNVFGAGKGKDDNTSSALVTGSTTVTMTKGSVAKSVYGGGELSQVGGDTHIAISGGTIGTVGYGGATYGNVYGGGFGSAKAKNDGGDVTFGLVKGNTYVTISDSAAIYHNIYGGGAFGSVGDFEYNANDSITGLKTAGTGVANITITGGTIGIDGHENGMVFGSSRGEVAAPGAIHDRLAWVYDANVIVGTAGSDEGPNVRGSLYGSGENGHTVHNTSVAIHSGMVGLTETMATDPDGQGGANYPYRGNVYGGGCGTDKYDNNTKYNLLSGVVLGNTSVVIDGGHVVRNVYGAGSMGSVIDTTRVTIGGNAVIGAQGSGGGYVYAAARGDEALSDAQQAHVGATVLTVGGGTVWGDAFGGGQAGIVKGAVAVNLTGGELKQDVYGGGALANTNTEYDASDNTKKTYVTTVTLAGATVSGDLYGGGLGRLYVAAVPGTPAVEPQGVEGEEGYVPGQAAVPGTPEVPAIAADVNGPVTLTVSNGKATRVFGSNNLNGSPKDTVAVVISGTVAMSSSASAISNVYGGGNLAAYNGSRGISVSMSGGTVGNVYGGGLGASAVVNNNTTVAISGGTVGNDVYGGGSEADVTGNVNVSISGGTVTNDVYGGGALANTNTGNWNGDGSLEYVAVTGLAGVTYRVKEVAVGVSVTGLYTYNSSTNTYIATASTDVAQQGTTYYEQLAGTPVAGYYKDDHGSDMYRSTTDVAVQGGTYYKKKVVGTWKEGYNNSTTGTTYKTTVSLTGGLIGNAYGGGLGRQATDAVAAVAANVYGDVTITVNKGVSDPTKGVTFVQRTEQAVIDGTQITTPTSGRVFGCNNHNGTPTGNVEVHVYATRQIDKDNNIIAGHGSSDRKYPYEIQSVYGGGNQADYLPADDKKSQVIIEGCEDTSIEKVYGGGNSAVVPETDVLIKGAYDIGYGFGGGNGDKPIKKADGNWYENEGAIVIGTAKIVCQGGKIGQVFGGGDSKGSCGNTNAVTQELASTDPDYCPLLITRLYGAGNKGDVAAVNIVLGACSGNAIEYVHGGSYNAHVTGDVHLTITSGILKNVYGGNDARGGIGGNIIVDIEETNGCNPIIIQNLVGGGNEAPYPGTYTNEHGEEVDYDKRGEITVNVKSATRIDNIYGGSFMAEARANTEVNINMMKGFKAGKTVTIPKEFSYIPNITGVTPDSNGKTITCTINDSIGTIGNVYGGGNQGLVKGNTVVNICTTKEVPIMKRDQSTATNDYGGDIEAVEGGTIGSENGSNIEGKTIKYENKPVIGADIRGSVFGGGNLADVITDTILVDNVKVGVGGHTTVNICAKETNGVYDAVAFKVDSVKIAGNVYGGGKGLDDTFTCEKAMVGKDGDNQGQGSAGMGTSVWIGNGTIGGTVYGGGQVSRVEFDTKVTIGFGNGTGGTKSPVIGGDVYGAGEGVDTHGYSGLVRGNSFVTIEGDSKVGHSVFGAGKMASLGRYWIAITPADTAAHHVELGMPYGLKSGGKSTVIIRGYAEIGPNGMTMPTFDGNVFGAGKGILPYVDVGKKGPGRYYMDKGVYTWESYADETEATETAYCKYTNTLGITDSTDVTIGGNAFIKGSVYGGSQNGHVRQSTYVKIEGGQIGCGKDKIAPFPWTGEDPADFTECASWDYDKTSGATYDKFATYESGGKYYYDAAHTKYAEGGAATGKDGHTYYGNVFGGGSGVFPYKAGKWHREAGAVGGNAKVVITGGHILTSVYGGNEQTDVAGNDTILMSGGTIGVPRTDSLMKAHPVTCYLFGAGKGDQRIFFNTWTNVKNAYVEVSGTSRIYGSVFGGGEDGHVLEDTKVVIKDDGVRIGTTGTSYVDGNVFGGGRGYSGEALPAGSVGGNVTLTISGGTMLGSVYGGGRLASVGIDFTPATDPSYGQLLDDGGGKTYGHIKIDISGGTIGTTTETGTAHPVGGNVFGGSMGRLTLLNESLNPLWPKQAVVKLTDVTISGTADIKNNVYGGSEYGVVRNQATVNVTGGTVHGSVFGGGYGSDRLDKTTITAGGYASIPTLYYTFTPMQWAGCVSGNTFVNVSGGKVEKNVYGGGDLASVGLINYNSSADGNTYNFITKHDDTNNGFALSWPYKFEYIEAAPNDDENIGGKAVGGKATVTITNGRIGTSGETGYVFGGGKGKAFERYTEAFCANVRETEVNVHYPSTPAVDAYAATLANDSCIVGAVYGGGEDGHVYGDAKVDITGGLVGLSIYAGGKGIGTYEGTLRRRADSSHPKDSTATVCSWTAGKVYGNTTLTMSGGLVLNNIYGGGYLGSVGKGNYASGTDDYYPDGYGETLTNEALWDGVSDNSKAFLGSGMATVTITGGTVGMPNGVYQNYPTGQVFGGSRGRAAEDVGALSPRYDYAPDFFLGYCNRAIVTIGDAAHKGNTETPVIYGNVFGGGRDGHVRDSAQVTIYGGVIGQEFSTIETTEGNTLTLPFLQRNRGNVFGSGSGYGTWDASGTKHGTSSGSVTRHTTVNIHGGLIRQNVYGGGAMASVGPPKLPPLTDFAGKDWSLCTVNIMGGKIGGPGYVGHDGGNVYGASRGGDTAAGESLDSYATTLWTDVNILGGEIAGDVYGGGQAGRVKKSTNVDLQGGTIAHDAYGGGRGTRESGANMDGIAATVGGDATVTLNNNNHGAEADGSKRGCVVDRIFGCNNLNGSPMGKVTVHIYATQNSAKSKIEEKFPKRLENRTTQIPREYLGLLLDSIAKCGYNANTPKIDMAVIERARTTYENSNPGTVDSVKVNLATDSVLMQLYKLYDVRAVYGGGNLAPYEAENDSAHVIIDGCELTSIQQVYGSGNAASTPSCHTIVNGTYEIDELFGGGNGRDNYEIAGLWYENPGANVGYKNYTHVSGGSGTKDDPYKAVENSNATDKEFRQAYYRYGSGVARTDVYGGRIHNAYGGSNEKGNISDLAFSVYEKASTCESVIDKTYGAGKNAEIDGEVQMQLDCVDYMANLFGGSTNSDVNSDIYLRVTNGRFGQVFGGNDTSGKIYGSITVEVQEQGCKPITIGKLYGGGFKAGYSVYGYHKGTGKLRTKKEFEDSLAIFNHNMETYLKQFAVDKRDSIEKDTLIRAGLFGYPKAEPRISIISATRIDSIFGGGYQATVIGSPHINVNMEPGLVTAKYVEKNEENFSVGTHTVDDQTYRVDSIRTGGDAILAIGTIGHIWGGGDLADVQGDTRVEIGTGRWIKNWRTNSPPEWEDIDRKAATITGNVFGGGKGEADEFTCAKAMVGIVDTGTGSTNVIIGNGTVGGSVYGGGEIGRVEKDTEVTIGMENGTDTVVIGGNVFGAGKGVETHGYSALARGNSTVTIQGHSKVGLSVYGGGEMATVGRYVVVKGVPVRPDTGGECTVTVRDHAEIGPNDMVMDNTVTHEPDDAGHVFGAGKGVVPHQYTYADNQNRPRRMMTYDGTRYTDANKALWEYADSAHKNVWEYFPNDSVYLAFIETLGLASKTEVSIDDSVFVKGSVYGGSENGFVQGSTHVVIDGDCQIGNGQVQMADDGTYLPALLSMNRRYTPEEWAAGRLIMGPNDRDTLKNLVSTTNCYQSTLPACASWPFGIDGDNDGTKELFFTYDRFADANGNYADSKSANGGRSIGSDGMSFYGNVFGGGSGYYPYAPGKWHYAAGSVGGNTLVEIKGGHILTSVYGGNELTDVGKLDSVNTGRCTVRMTGGTIGVPRTLRMIANQPICSFLFGGGRGDPRTNFSTFTNVKDVELEVAGGVVYGSVYGGAEDGHVIDNVKVDIKPGARIGTMGYSTYDGNVFGGGRGFPGEALTAGMVGDSVMLNITGGTILGSVYGGGRMASVGYDLRNFGDDDFGTMSADPARGHVVVNISGGTIGNDQEFVYIAPNATSDQVTAARANIPTTQFDATTNRVLHTQGGNVFAGGMGRFKELVDSIVIPRWYDLGKVKSTKLTISDSVRIKGNVYGGCELGWVSGKHQSDAVAGTDSLSTEILITGGTIGTEVVDRDSIPRYTFGSVYGGGRGDTMEKLYKEEKENMVSDNPKFYAGRVVGSTSIKMQDGTVLGSVFGGGEVGNVGMATSYGEVADKKVATNVVISGGTIGRDTLVAGGDTIRFGGPTMGNVYGGGSGDRSIVRCGLVLGNTNVLVSDSARIYHNIYGGGAYGTVGDFGYETRIDNVEQTVKVFGVKNLATDSTGIARVTITGGEIGIDGYNNGMVFGSSRGDVVSSQMRDDYMAWAYDTHVHIGNAVGGFKAPEPRIHGSIYGGGENGHVLRNAHVDIRSGYIGDTLSYYGYRGNVYGAGCGTDTIMVAGVQRYKPMAGVVRGNTNIDISGGLITGGIYGAGAMAYVGTVNNDTTLTENKHTVAESSFALSWPYKFEFADTTGTATINITGGHIGINGTDGGDVYGSARGEAGDRYITAHHAYVKEAIVNIDLPRTATPAALDSTDVSCITGSVHGSGEDGYVYGDTHVTLNKGLVGHSVYGGGKGKGTYPVTLARMDDPSKTYTTGIYSLLSGRVLGNTYVTMNDGHVIRNIYGGGNMGSVGKGNYAGAPDDYFTDGYGEKLTGNLWDSVSVDSKAFLASGKTTVKVLAGTVGNPDKLTEFKESLPLGNVFGGSRGEAAPNVPRDKSPRYHYCPTFFSGYVNESDITIGTDSTDGPRILCSVYGGGQDGHVRRWTNIEVNSGTIGLPFTDENKRLMGKTDVNDSLWLYRGNVYGAGSGISEFEYDFNDDRDYNDSFTIGGAEYSETGHSTSAGSVTHFTHVDIKGGTIYRNVAGGGSLACVGPLRTSQDDYAATKGTDPTQWGKQSLNQVIIGGGKNKAGEVMRPNIGERAGVNAGYGGNVFGGSRGEPSLGSAFATSVWTQVYVKDGANIVGNVFGGGNAGEVLKDTDVQIGEPKAE